MRSAVGIDVAQDTLVLAIHAQAGTTTYANTPGDRAKLRRRLQRLQPASIVVESTGGLERPLVEALHQATLPIATVNPRKIRHFALATGKLAKTDPIDAAVIAHFAATVTLPPSVHRSANERIVQARVHRRAQLQDDLQAEGCRKARAPKVVHASIERVMRLLAKEIAQLDAQIAAGIAADPQLAAKAQLLTAVPGVGPGLLAALLAELPELGQLSRNQIAALAGVAPYDVQSGTHRGHSQIRGGRPLLRKALYLAMLSAARHNPLLRPLRERLRARSKSTKVILIACARKLLTILNAMLRDGTCWNPEAHMA